MMLQHKWCIFSRNKMISSSEAPLKHSMRTDFQHIIQKESMALSYVQFHLIMKLNKIKLFLLIFKHFGSMILVKDVNLKEPSPAEFSSINTQYCRAPSTQHCHGPCPHVTYTEWTGFLHLLNKFWSLTFSCTASLWMTSSRSSSLSCLSLVTMDTWHR